MRFFYTLFIYFYASALYVCSLFNVKARLWCKGRKNLFAILKADCAGKNNVYWFHCASLGEFEQGKPLIRKLKDNLPGITVLVTFFSPSGFEVKKNDPIADVISYLPIDTPCNVRKFLEIVNPKAAIFVKYEYWYNFIDKLAESKIPFYYIAAIYRPSQHFFKKYGKWFANQLKKASFFFVQNEESKSLLHSIGIDNVEITGDTRFDRVHAVASSSCQLNFVCDFKKNKKLIVAGSTWKHDEKLLVPLLESFKSNYKLIIAPHLVDKEHISNILNYFSGYKTVCYSACNNLDLAEYQVLIIDSIGLLSKIYKYADISYIGGGFETGLHNILEPAVFGVPLFFGPHYKKFNEAVELVRLGGAFSIHNSAEMNHLALKLDSDTEYYNNVCTICKKFVQNNIGASDKIFNILKSVNYE
jgi:3-deoxy-D-manno-octulosonic-acid transferase